MKIKVDSSKVQKLLSQNKTLGEKIIERAYDHFVSITPVDTGNAQRNTHLIKSSLTIVADYPYAYRLDTGWSKQAPRGMSNPTLRKLDEWTSDELRKMKNA